MGGLKSGTRKGRIIRSVSRNTHTTGASRPLTNAFLVEVDQSSVMGHCPDPKPKKRPYIACSDCGHVGNGQLIDYSTGKCRGRVNCAERARETQRA
jgi:hypothetical protein